MSVTYEQYNLSINDKDAADKILKDLDDNGDSEVDFEEFIFFVEALICICHSYFFYHKYCKLPWIKASAT
uniref:EF-hand domain-containing protein n=1 Tax=Erpetoichthys calabaricus TaxID=27687 RepID=A0A8C4X5V9_ERPCA